MFPISAKKCKKYEFFSSILALNFCEFRRFFSSQKPLTNCGPRRLALVCRTKRMENLQKSNEQSFFFFGDQRKIVEKDASIRAMTFFFSDHIKTGHKHEKNFQHRSRTLQELWHFYIEFRTFTLFPTFSQK